MGSPVGCLGHDPYQGQRNKNSAHELCLRLFLRIACVGSDKPMSPLETQPRSWLTNRLESNIHKALWGHWLTNALLLLARTPLRPHASRPVCQSLWMNDVHALGKLCCSWEEGRSEWPSPQECVENQTDFPQMVEAASAPSLLACSGPFPPEQQGPAARQLRAPLLGGRASGPRRERARARLTPPGLPFVLGHHRRLVAGPRPGPRAAPAPRCPRPSLPPAEILGDGGAGVPGAQTQRPRLGAARNALKRGGERARERGRESCSGERDWAAAACRRRGGSGARTRRRERARRRRGWDPGRAHFSAKCQLPRRECRARTFWARGKVSRNLRF